MKLHFITDTPVELKAQIIKFVEDGETDTWTIHRNNNVKFLKHTRQWGNKGVVQLIADAQNNHLKVNIRKFSECEQELEEFQGFYLGRFCELMYNSFWEDFSSIEKDE